MPYQPSYYRPPAIYSETMQRRREDALRDAQRRAHAGDKQIQQFIDQHGERMSDEGKGLLAGLAETLKTIAETMGAKDDDG